MKKKYLTPEFDAVMLSKEDVLAASDVLIDGSDLFGTTEE